MNKIDVKRLASLAHIEIDNNEIEELEEEISNILRFVEQIGEAGGTTEKKEGSLYNVFREDGDPHDPGMYSNDLIDAMPDSKDGYMRVTKIINNE